MKPKRRASTLANMVLVLLAITLAAGVTLGFVNQWTLEPKAAAQRARKLEALSSVLPEFNNQPVDQVVRLAVGRDSIEYYPAYMDDTFVGAAVTGYSEKGYSGNVRIMVGFEPDGTILNIAVLEQKETPGLGTKMKGESFIRQFRGQNPSGFDLRVEKDGGEVDALAGATISSRAFCEAALMAYEAYVDQQNAQPDK
ncbi:RnfABCDGE type electron transport complex subunit G [Robiginitalea sediminis]|uniref:RnfABCDGE type electron transport complex subunit G n=1 Tax=Robiginitalea sediminis TaxID=1982593 RepID=UPI000B4B109A|nr:RnfABCDGE type electron transport complex subunit G [Robiginitalea sediminis]